MIGDNIIIFNTESPTEAIREKSERELFYENIAKNVHLEPYVEIYCRLDVQLEKDKIIQSTIHAILIDQIIPYIIPIIDLYESDSISNNYINRDENHKSKIRSKTTQNFRSKKKPMESEYKYIVYKTRDNIECLSKFFKKVTISKDTTINIIGFVINSDRIPNTFDIGHYFNDNPYSTTNLSPIDMIISGNYSLKNILTNTYYKYHTVISGILNMSDVKGDIIDKSTARNLKLSDKKLYYLYFLKSITDSNISNILNYTIDFIKSSRYYYENSLYNLYLYANTYSEVYLSIYKKYNDTLQVQQQIAVKYQYILDKIHMITGYDFTYNNLFNILTSLYNFKHIQLFNYFNKLTIKGNEYLYKDIEFIIKSLSTDNLYEKEKYKKLFELYKKQKISYSKFKIKDINLLSNEQLSVVQNQYDKDTNPVLSRDNILAISLSRAIEDDNKNLIIKLLDDLYKELKINPTKISTYTTFIKNKIGDNIICPHIILKANIIVKSKNVFDRNDRIAKDVVINYADPSIDESAYFCKICGEKLADIDDTGMAATSYEMYTVNIQSNDYDRLYTIIYNELVYIFNNFVIIGTSINVTRIVKNICIQIKNAIGSIESNLLKIKTIGKEDSSLIINIYIYIYAFAFLTQLVYANDSISFRKELVYGARSPFIQYANRKSDKSTINDIKSKTKNTAKNRQNLQNVINDALMILKKIKSSDIQKTSSISMDSIKILFMDAYKWVLNINFSIISYSTVDYFIQDNIINYFIYIYNQKQYRSNRPTINRIDADKLPFLIRNVNNTTFKQVSNVLGKTYKEIHDSKEEIYKHLIKIDKWTNDKYKLKGSDFLYEYIKNGIYLLSPLSPKSIGFYSAYLDLQEEDRVRKLKSKFFVLKPYYKLLNSYKDFNREYEIINSVEKQCKCDDQIYVYEISDKTNKEYKFTKKEIIRWIEENNKTQLDLFKKMHLTNIICNCVSTSKFKHIDIFYKFYENVCPEGDLHNYVIYKNEYVCSRCKISADIFETRNKKYYEKYKKVYEKTKFKEDKDTKKLFGQKISKIVKSKEYNIWKIRSDKMTDLSDLLNISLDELYGIGLYEKHDYNQIKLGNVNLLKDLTYEQYTKKNNHLYDYYLFIIRSYYTLRSSEYLTLLPIHIRNIINKYYVKDIGKKLPLINEDFIETYRFQKRHISAEEMSNFLLFSICDTLIRIYEIFVKNNLDKMGYDFISALYDNILNFEKKLTNFIVLKIKKTHKIEEYENIDSVRIDLDENNNEDFDNVNQDEETMSLEEAADDDIIEDEFSLDHVDVEEYDEDVLYKDLIDKNS